MPVKSRVLLEWSTGPPEQSTLLKLFDFLGLLLALANNQLWFQSVYFNPLLPYLILFSLERNKLEPVPVPALPEVSKHIC